MFYNPERPLKKHLNHLPHWQQDKTWVFITWRLADSVPSGLLDEWHSDREKWELQHPKPWDDITELEFHRRFSSRLEEWMDQGMGECILRNPEHARIVAECILHFDRVRYVIDSFVIMPNHVHLLVSFEPDYLMAKELQSWKRHSARGINELRNETGSLWQKGYWDRLVRSEEHFWKIRRYILRNPEKAKLRENEYLLYTPWNP